MPSGALDDASSGGAWISSPEFAFVAPALTIVSGRAAVGAAIPTVASRALAVVGSIIAGLDCHLRLVLCERCSDSGAQITPGGRLVARLGGAVPIVRRPIVLIALVGVGHRGSLTGANVARAPSRLLTGLQAWRAGHCVCVASASWSIPALAEEVGGVRHAAVEFARGEGVPNPPLEDLRLAISEAATNAVIHAFRTQEGTGTITVTVDVTLNELVEAVVRDDGMGMSSRRDSPGLGLGLGLIGSVADAVEARSPADGVGFELWMSFRLGST